MAKLNDIEAYDRLHAAGQALGNDGGVTPAADTALQAARRALIALQMGLLRAIETPPKEPLPPPPY